MNLGSPREPLLRPPTPQMCQCPRHSLCGVCHRCDLGTATGQVGEGVVCELPGDMDHVGQGSVPSAQHSVWHRDSGQEILTGAPGLLQGLIAPPVTVCPTRPWAPCWLPLLPGRMLRLVWPTPSPSLWVPHWCSFWVTVLRVGTFPSGNQVPPAVGPVPALGVCVLPTSFIE